MNEKQPIDFLKEDKYLKHATLLKAKIQNEKDDDNKFIKEDLLDISLEAGILVSSSLSRRTLYCPFCADECMFEFILKDHLKSKHYNDIKMMRNHDDNSSQAECPYCKAFFVYSTLVPQHILKVHGKDQFEKYLKDESENLFSFQNDKEKEIRFVTCSPGLSELFNEMDTCDSIKKLKRSESSRSLDSNPQLKSILKKTSNSPRIFFSPASASIRRTRENIKRSASVRRELRFDLPPLPKSPDDPNLPPASKIPNLFKNSDGKFFNWNLFSKKKHITITKTSPVKRKIKTRSCKYAAQTAGQLVTSTPINALDDFEDEFYGANWKSTIKDKFRPSFYLSERYQCNVCQNKFESNADLLCHIQDQHNKMRLSLHPQYKCGQCGVKFYRNSFLVRHCHLQHTPIKS